MHKNTPELWLSSFPRPDETSHKYTRGSALIIGSVGLTGATRLAAESCARMGSGLVTVAGGKKADVYRSSLPAHILVTDAVPNDVSKYNAFLTGPGGKPTLFRKRKDLKCPVVLDADAIIGYRDYRHTPQRILTPHEGEFLKMFPHLRGSREERAGRAAEMAESIVVLKGHNTVVAAPDGNIVIDEQVAPYLATAGTGDVLAGMMTGLLAQGMPAFEAACAAVWVHTRMGAGLAAGMVASDMSNTIPYVLRDLGL